MEGIKHNESKTGEECYYNPQVDYFPLFACLSVLFPLKQQFANKFINLFLKYCTFWKEYSNILLQYRYYHIIIFLLQVK